MFIINYSTIAIAIAILPSYRPTIVLAICALCVFSFILTHFLVIMGLFYFLLFLFYSFVLIK